MLLAIDVGNTSTKLAVFDGETLVRKFRLSTNRWASAANLNTELQEEIKDPISGAIACSVVPEMDEVVGKVLKAVFSIDVFFVATDLDLGLEINYFDVPSLGADRLVNAYAAAEKYGMPSIICSFGTATTIDAVTDKGFLPAVIAPGAQMMADALHHFTSKLPAVDVLREAWVVTPSTEDCIRVGTLYSQIGLVEAAVRDIRKDVGEAQVIATGGFASMIAKNTDVIDTVDETLLLDGLRLIHERIITAK